MRAGVAAGIVVPLLLLALPSTGYGQAGAKAKKKPAPSTETAASKATAPAAAPAAKEAKPATTAEAKPAAPAAKQDSEPLAALVPDAPAAAVAEPAKPASQSIGLQVALKFALLIPAGKTSSASAAAEGTASASKAVFASGALALRYGLPFLDRALAIAVEGGYYRLAGSGTRAFVNDPDFGPSLSYSWKSHAVPVLVGLAFRLPIPIPVAFSPEAGFAAVYVIPTTTYEAPDGTRVSDSPQPAWALGFYVGLEGSLKLGPGSIVAEVRYLNARTDLGFKQLYSNAYNKDLGDVQGTNVLVGYRFEF
ncbi:MAG TPA: hypothetical protein VGK67_11750 [Myxococcales bacterium]|jgi:hypothetical protein